MIKFDYRHTREYFSFDQRLADKVVELYDRMIVSNWTSGVSRLSNLDKSIYRDSDIPSRLPDDMHFSP